MCGIAGAVGLSPAVRPKPERVRAMSRCLAHRGPDGEGLWISPSGRACFAHRRLAVIDLETGQQPMVNDTGAIGLVFNGEIYNYLELKQVLERTGSQFRTKSDTEVLLQLFARDGADCVHSLRGMFAFAAWSDDAGTLMLARDKLGKKPLYFTISHGCLYFASSLRALREVEDDLQISSEAVDLFLALGYIPAPLTIYANVHKLPAATYGHLAGEALVLQRFWDLAGSTERFEGSYLQAVERLEDLLTTAVRLRLRSDVPLGVFLSGGIDSSLVAAIANKQSERTVQTFSMGFDAGGFDESDFARTIAEHLGTRHHLFRTRAEVSDLLPRIARHYGEPFGDSSALPTWILAEHARAHVTVALGGDGGDEGFAGYDWYRTAARLFRVSRFVPSRIGSFAGAALGKGGRKGNRIRQIRKALTFASLSTPGAQFGALRSFVEPGQPGLLFKGPLLEQRQRHGDRAMSLLCRTYDKAQGSQLRRMRYVDIETYLSNDLLPKVDVATMAHGLELRAPLLDQEVVTFALSLPDDFVRSGAEGKHILRDLLARYIPRALFERPKQGFSVPLALWFRRELRLHIEALSRSERLLSLGMLREDGIANLVSEQRAGQRDHTSLLYNILMLDEWLRATHS